MLIFEYVVVQYIVFKVILQTFFHMTFTLAGGWPQRQATCSTLKCLTVLKANPLSPLRLVYYLELLKKKPNQNPRHQKKINCNWSMTQLFFSNKADLVRGVPSNQKDLLDFTY